jgi:hypothetical protein
MKLTTFALAVAFALPTAAFAEGTKNYASPITHPITTVGAHRIATWPHNESRNSLAPIANDPSAYSRTSIAR